MQNGSEGEGGRGLGRLSRVLPLTGVVFAVVAMAGNLTIGDFPDEHTSVASLTAYYAHHHDQVGRGGTLLGYSVVFFALFGLALWARVRRTAPPLVAGAVLLGTAMTAVDLLTSANTYSTLGEVAGDGSTSPQALQAWHITGSVGGVGADWLVLLLACAAAGILARAVPRWLALSALILAVMHVTPLSFLAYLLFHVWAIAAGIALTVRPGTEPAAVGAEVSPKVFAR